MAGNGTAQPFISLNDVTIRLYDRVLFEHASWRMASDQHWAVLGPNGSGKSVLMKALCGQVPVIGGKITYHFCEGCATPQKHVAHVSFDAQRAVVGHQDPFYQARWNSARSGGGVSVADYLSTTQLTRSNPFQLGQGPPVSAPQGGDGTFEARRAEVIELLGLGAVLGRHMVQLSNGERRKLFIARALLRAPRLLVLDNPFAGLDQLSSAGLHATIERLTQGGMRVIVVGTDRDEVPPGITHGLLVQNGRVVVQGPIQQVMKDWCAGRRAEDQSQQDTRRTLQPSATPQTTEAIVRPVLVQMRDVHICYNSTKVLEGVDWTVREGEHWALVGSNGAGKTTLLSLILADSPQAYANRIALFGRDRGSGESIWEIKQQVGWVAPELHLYYPIGATGEDIVCSGFFDSVGLYRRCLPEQRAAARSWMERLSISNLGGTPFARLSEGQQRMVLVARAFVKQPRLLVLDEPCQGLDRSNRDLVLQAIDVLASHLNATTIYVTHRSDELPRIITHVIRLDQGRAVTQGRLTGERRVGRHDGRNGLGVEWGRYAGLAPASPMGSEHHAESNWPISEGSNYGSE